MRARLTATVLLAILLCTSVATGCIGEMYTLEKGRLMVGTSPGFEPFSFRRDEKITGFDIDLAREIAGRLGLEVQVVPVQWDWLIAGLFAETYDVVMSAMTITPGRDAEIDFLGPYFETDQAIVVSRVSSISSAAGLRGRTVGVLEDSTGLEAAKKVPGIGEVREFKDIDKAYESLKAGYLDAVIADESTAEYPDRTTRGTRVAAQIETDEVYGMGILNERSELGRDIQFELIRIMNDGTYAEIYRKWFGKQPMELPR